ncbi:hypothetical protein INS49_000953 [Diaporthe citri]|uniref:uncharacterized protein n=1 Tax=Diaporthe citri TaxID=83186 RepID=UPI001C7FE0C1|nr:uncharacterized protein INS49_000953 [Diaporthe citri]KAG6366773.1 hypothetical protein INS49_000953 [Diaporthe citri]
MFANLATRHTVALIAVATPTVYLFLLRRSVMRNVESCNTQQYGRGAQTGKTTQHWQAAASPPSEPPLPRSLPQSVVADDTPGYVLWNERVVSKPVALSELRWSGGSLDELLTRYVRATMVAFTWTPQAYLIRKMLPAGVGETFEADYINTMDFAELGKRVDGVYTVQYRGTDPGGERVEMRLSPPEEYTGPRSGGIIVAAIEPVGAGAPDEVVFVNETWLWRNPDEKPTLLEGSIGRWFHSLLAAWLIGKGIKPIRREEFLAKK